MIGHGTHETARLFKQALDTFDSQAIMGLAQAGERHDQLKNWLHDACDLVARRALEEGKPDRAAEMFHALEALAPAQSRRWRSITRKMDEASHLVSHLIALGRPEIDTWAKNQGLWLNRRALFALIDRWIAEPLSVDIAAAHWNASDKIKGMANGALIGLAVLRGDRAVDVQEAAQRMGLSKYAIATGLVRVARRITDQQDRLDWARWPAKDGTLAWIHDVCDSHALLEAARLLAVPPDIHQQTILPLVERVMLAPLEAGTAQVPPKTDGGRGLRL